MYYTYIHILHIYIYYIYIANILCMYIYIWRAAVTDRGKQVVYTVTDGNWRYYIVTDVSYDIVTNRGIVTDVTI